MPREATHSNSFKTIEVKNDPPLLSIIKLQQTSTTNKRSTAEDLDINLDNSSRYKDLCINLDIVLLTSDLFY